MPSLPYINIHTHHLPEFLCQESAVNGQVHNIELYNCIVNKLPKNKELMKLFTAGIHPWYITAENRTSSEQCIIELVTQSNCMAIGECGLDRLCGVDYEIQIQVFDFQIKLAILTGKPLVIHQVRSMDEVLQRLSLARYTRGVIFHGYNNRLPIGRKALAMGHYLSFGSAIFNENSPARIMLKETPLNRILLETDDAQVAIASIYESAANILEIELDELKAIIFANYQRIF